MLCHVSQLCTCAFSFIYGDYGKNKVYNNNNNSNKLCHKISFCCHVCSRAARATVQCRSQTTTVRYHTTG